MFQVASARLSQEKEFEDLVQHDIYVANLQIFLDSLVMVEIRGESWKQVSVLLHTDNWEAAVILLTQL